MTRAQSSTKNTLLPFAMWFFPVVFFSYQFILRLWPGLMMQQIMAQFSIDASQFGIIAAFYYYGYAGMQIPVAMLLERFGARAIVFSFALLCAGATLLFTYSTHWYLACLSRFLIGAGSAVGFLGVSKVISEWFPTNQYSKMIGYSLTAGLFGAVYGGKPISILIATYHWQTVALALAVASMIIGCGAYLVLRPPHSHVQDPKDEALKMSEFKEILSSTTLWWLALSTLLMVGSLEGFSDAWGVPYLMTAYTINKATAAELISFVFIGMLFGGPLLSWMSQKVGYYAVIAGCGFGITLAFIALLLNQHYHWGFLAGLFFIVGVMGCYQIIVFSAGANLVKARHLGLSVAFINCINMLGGSFFHTAIGQLMDKFWTGTLNGEGIKQYSLHTYQYALMIVPICAMLGAIIVCLIGIRPRLRRVNGVI